MFNGIIHYSVLADSSPTAAPTTARVAVKKDNVVVAQQLIQIDGVTEEKLSGQTLGNFEGVTGNFLTDAIRSSGVKVIGVIVSPDITENDVTKKERWLRILRRLANNSTAGNETLDDYSMMTGGLNGSVASSNNETNTTNNSQQRSLGLYTTIAGEYRPPPFIDFDTLVESSFNDKGDVSTKTFIDDLKKKDSHFANATAVKTETVKFPLPPEIQSLIDKPGLSQTTLYIIYGSCGFVVLVALIILIAMWHRNRRKQLAVLKQEDSEIEKFNHAQDPDYPKCRDSTSYYSGRLHVDYFERQQASIRSGRSYLPAQ